MCTPTFFYENNDQIVWGPKSTVVKNGIDVFDLFVKAQPLHVSVDFKLKDAKKVSFFSMVSRFYYLHETFGKPFYSFFFNSEWFFQLWATIARLKLATPKKHRAVRRTALHHAATPPPDIKINSSDSVFKGLFNDCVIAGSIYSTNGFPVYLLSNRCV